MKNLLSQGKINVIKDQCKKYNIKSYTFKMDGSIDVDGNVDISLKLLKALPLKFNTVTGNFYCHLNELETLEGAPSIVGGHFYCQSNRLTSLEHVPVKVGGDFNCSVNRLTTLEYCPEQIRGSFSCSENKLTNLVHGPKNISNNFYCSWNQLTSLVGCPEKVGNNFECNNNPPLASISELTTSFDGKLECFESNLPLPLKFFLRDHDQSEIKTFLKYQNQVDIWSPDFNEDNFNDLLEEIKEGLL